MHYRDKMGAIILSIHKKIFRQMLAKAILFSQLFTAAGLASVGRLCSPGRGEEIYLDINLHERQNVYLAVALAETGAISFSLGHAPLMLKLLSAQLYARAARISWSPPASGYIITDKHQEEIANLNVVEIRRDYYSCADTTGQKVIPYFAHPEFYKRRLYKSAHKLRRNRRSIRIFFAGTNSRQAYASRFEFPILSRDVILDFINSQFQPEIRGGDIRLEITNDTTDTIEKYALTPDEYLKKISRADFFICPPGWLMPHSHNMIEAMSVGTIPITNYNQYVKPAMEPGKNCLAFNSTEGLEVALRKALNMTIPEIEKMREHTINYYESFLDPASFGLELRSSMGKIKTLIVNDESGK